MNSYDSHNPARRRLGKGALGSSVVLASLMSKNALAGSYNCAVSGAMSGNLSPAARKGNTTTNCATMGKTREGWRGTYPVDGSSSLPPFLLSKGCLGRTRGGNVRIASVAPSNESGWSTATINQILWGTTVGTIPDEEFFIRTLCVYLNALKVSSYHITTDDCSKLYMYALGSSNWKHPTGKTWTPAQCRAHINMLYTGA